MSNFEPTDDIFTSEKNSLNLLLSLAASHFNSKESPLSNHKKAIAFLKKAASLGSGEANYELFKIRQQECGDAVPYDNESTALLLAAANQGCKNAQLFLGIQYYFGNTLPKSIRDAKIWLRKASEQNFYIANIALVNLCLLENAEDPNKTEALYWLQQQNKTTTFSSLQLHEKIKLGLHLFNDEKEAEELFQKGLFYLDEKNGTPDYSKSMQYLLEANELFHVDAFFHIGKMYFSGLGVPQDFTGALGWFELAAENYHALANYTLGEMYEFGNGVKLNENKSLQYYKIAAKLGHLDSQVKVAEIYYYGRGVTTDYYEARFYYLLAAEQQHAPSQYQLGLMYFYAKGGNKNDNIAIDWLQKAVKNGYNKIENLKTELPFNTMYDDDIF